MKTVTSLSDPAVAAVLDAGGIVVARTDTIYGILARADDEKAVQRVFAVKGRADYKSPIVLIASREQMLVPLPAAEYELSMTVWPGRVTIAIPIDKSQAPVWLHRGNDEFGHRMPDNEDLRALISKTGPLIAPSANPEGKEPAKDIDEAKAYFGDKVDLYVEGGRVEEGVPSQLLRIDENGAVQRLR
ncbi:MAG TPA: L-threonylcarbamoyladenylate synthase [Patescibacteria group bacterium]|jgi:L-threonylcarbamoyladenylate synthase|nr:L-threonylcarbamoyladenylate synthase [Patescibacteria group bacterium]